MGKRNYYNNAEPEVVQGTPFEESEAAAEPIMEAPVTEPAVEEKPVEKEKPKKEEKKVLSFKGTVRA